MTPLPRDPIELAARVRGGDRRALARSLSLIEDGAPAATIIAGELWEAGAAATTVGITGPPGVGKSTLVASLIAHLRGLGLTVGVISVDPSSAQTHGALLGDRVRMTSHDLDPGVFVRSMATRGHLGGLADSTLIAARVLAAFGWDVVLIETVGVGQSEIEVRDIADCVVLTLQPASGDTVQALKAGIMEIPDVICVNKRDLPGTAAFCADLRRTLSIGGSVSPPIVATEARAGEGLDDLWSAVTSHLARLGSGGLEARRVAGERAQIRSLALARAADRIDAALASESGGLSPLERVERLLAQVARPGEAAGT